MTENKRPSEGEPAVYWRAEPDLTRQTLAAQREVIHLEAAYNDVTVIDESEDAE